MVKRYIYFCITFFLVFIISAYFVTYGTWHFMGGETWSAAFDSLAIHLKRFEFDVDAERIGFEGFHINGKTYMHFGVFPAFIRMLLDVIYPNNYGMWPRVSSLIAVCLATTFSFFTFSFALKTNKNENIREKSFMPLILTLGMMLGTPFFYLSTCARIYNEAVIWGASFAIISISIFYRIILNAKISKTLLALYGVSATLTLISRITFAIPLYALCFYLFFRIYKEKEAWRTKWLILASTAGVGGFFQLFYNYMRFGSIFETYPNSMHYFEEVRKYGYFNIRRIYDGIVSVFFPTLDNFSSTFPYFMQNTHNYRFEFLYNEYKEPYMAITLSCLFFTFLVLGFLYKVIFKFIKDRNSVKKDDIFNVYTLTILLLTLECLLICTCHFVTERYLAEFVPLIFFLSLVFTSKVKSECAVKFLSVFIILSIFITILGSISEIIYFIDNRVEMAWVDYWKNVKTFIDSRL